MEIRVRDSVCSSWSHPLAIFFFFFLANIKPEFEYENAVILIFVFFWLPLMAVGWFYFL